MQTLFHIFDSIQPLEPELKEYIQSHLKRKAISRGEIVLQEGQISRNIYFIEQGLVRAFRHHKNKDKTIWLMKENDIFLSVGSFFSQKPATETIEALEDSILHSITFHQLQYAYKHFPAFNLHRAIILEKYYELSESRDHMRTQANTEKYKYLMTHQPELVGRVHDIHLASYLGIARSTLAREKVRFTKGKKP